VPAKAGECAAAERRARCREERYAWPAIVGSTGNVYSEVLARGELTTWLGRLGEEDSWPRRGRPTHRLETRLTSFFFFGEERGGGGGGGSAAYASVAVHARETHAFRDSDHTAPAIERSRTQPGVRGGGLIT